MGVLSKCLWPREKIKGCPVFIELSFAKLKAYRLYKWGRIGKRDN